MSSDKESLSFNILPPPVLAKDQDRRPRFVPPGAASTLRVRWSKLKKRIGSGSSPDESLGEPTNGTDSDAGGSALGRRGTRDSSGKEGKEGEEDEDEVDEVVVENDSAPERWTRVEPGSSDGRGGTGTSPGTGGVHGATRQSECSSLRNTAFESAGPLSRVANFCQWRVYPLLKHFFSPRYHDEATEEAYQKELWYTSKSTAIFGSIFLIINWVLLVSLLPRPWSRWNHLQGYLFGPLLSVPFLPMACLDFPRKHWYVWQTLLLASVCISSTSNVVDMHLCNYYHPTLRSCGNRDFMGTLYYATALPVMALFALSQSRLFSAFSSIVWIIVVAATILPLRTPYVRNVVNIILFQGFVLYTHYRREVADRRMYLMRAELKVQFRAKQKAQINERKTMDSKRRFSSYIFHEVRVPLNTALLAVQNLEWANVFDKASEQALEYAALEGSLQMMSQVLNDVLDFSRMEKGGFSSVSRPFSFHSVMRSILGPLKLDATARGLALESYLDPRVDEVAKKAAYPAEECEGIIEEGAGMVMGDEMRLRQVINNLASNACKFTSSGQIGIYTSLIYPSEPFECCSSNNGEGSGTDQLASPKIGSDTTSATLGSPKNPSSAYSAPHLSTNRLQQHEAKTCAEQTSSKILVVRIEIRDTGVGIKKSDMAENRLFSAYVQTEIGRHQGGKGTGLGLSLVRQIVKLSGGRLGVKSRVGEGSTFWVEMPFGVGPQTRKTDNLEPHRRVNSMATEMSTPSEYRFLPSLRRGQSDTPLDKIDEQGGTTAQIQLVPTNYRFASPAPTPVLSSDGQLPSLPSPLPSPALAILQGSGPFLRPDNVAHLSSSSAPPTSSTRSSAAQRLEFADGPLRVLVVDDDVLTRKLMGRMMERLGCEVTTAENGQVALDLLLGPPEREGNSDATRPGAIARDVFTFDVTFLDNQMPVCSGLQMVARLRAVHREDLVIGVTANAALTDIEEYCARGASHVLTKPVLEADLRRFLRIADKQRSEVRSSQAQRLSPTPPAPFVPS